MKRRALLSLVLAMALLVVMAVPVGAANPTVTITVSAQVISITNSHPTWNIGLVTVSAVKYFSADNSQDDDYATITNTGNVAVNVAISCTDFVAANTTFNWVLAAAAGDQIYSLYANLAATPTVYDVEVKKSTPNYVTAVGGLAAGNTNKWSMNFTAPSAFHAEDNGLDKTATVTLAASKVS